MSREIRRCQKDDSVSQHEVVRGATMTLPSWPANEVAVRGVTMTLPWSAIIVSYRSLEEKSRRLKLNRAEYGSIRRRYFLQCLLKRSSAKNANRSRASGLYIILGLVASIGSVIFYWSSSSRSCSRRSNCKSGCRIVEMDNTAGNAILESRASGLFTISNSRVASIGSILF